MVLISGEALAACFTMPDIIAHLGLDESVWKGILEELGDANVISFADVACVVPMDFANALYIIIFHLMDGHRLYSEVDYFPCLGCAVGFPPKLR